MNIARRLLIYVLVFYGLLIVFTLTDLWKPIDYAVYEAVYLKDKDNIDLNQDIVLIDLLHPTTETPGLAEDKATPRYRKRLINLLDAIAAKVDEEGKPLAIVLDVYFENKDAEKKNLKEAIEQLTRENIKIYGVFNTKDSENIEFEDRLAEHAQDLYQLFYKDPYLHTIIEKQGSLLFYKSEIELKTRSGDSRVIEALPQRIARDLNRNNIKFSGEIRGYVLPVGQDQKTDEKTFVFSFEEGQDSGGKFNQDSAFSIDQKVLIIGSLKKDQLPAVPQAGPELVAWALNDQMNTNPNAKRPLDRLAILLGEIVFFSLFVVGIYALLFKFIHAWQTKPVLLAVLSFVAGVGMLTVLALALLSLDWFMPVGLTIIAMALAAVLSWRYAYVYLIAGVVEGSGKYDVFISYSRKDGDWVLKQLYEPLRAIRRSDGSELSIFFDREEIKLGEAFTPKYMWAIVDSRFFIPVFSKNYYGAKSHGKNEMDMANKRAIEKRITMLPITHSFDAIPEIYSHLNFIDAGEQADFFEKIKASILGDVAQSETAAPVDVEA